MENIGKLLDKAKVIHSLPSDYKLAQVMGVQQGSLRNYRDGKTLPDARVITRLCELTGDDPALLAAEIEAHRAKTDEARALWLTIAKRLAVAAAAGAVSVAAVASPIVAPLATVCILCKVALMAVRGRLRRPAYSR